MNGKSLVEDIYNIDGDTTVPVHREENVDKGGADSFASSFETNEPPDVMDEELPDDPKDEDKVEDGTNQNIPMVDTRGMKRGLGVNSYMEHVEENKNLNLDDSKEEKMEGEKLRVKGNW